MKNCDMNINTPSLIVSICYFINTLVYNQKSNNYIILFLCFVSMNAYTGPQLKTYHGGLAAQKYFKGGGGGVKIL